MKIVVLNTNFEQVKVVDTFISFIWTDRYREYGDFELYFSMDSDLLNYFKEDYYLWCDESEHLMIIEELEIKSDVENGDCLSITGRSLESILDRRIVWGKKDFSGNLQNGIKTLLEEAIISPQIEERKIENFIFEESTNPKVTELVLDAEYTGKDLYSIIKDLCELNKIGFKIILNDNNQFVFSLYAGTDRSYEQSVNPYVIFSPNYDNIINSNYFMSKKEFKNVALVTGEGDDWASKKKITVGSASGLNRREIFTDSSGVSKEVDGTTLTDAQYSARLREKGQLDLDEHSVASAFEGETDTSRMFKYGEDFFMGDIVQIANEYGHEGAAYISEVVASLDENGFSVYPTFKSIQDGDGKPNLAYKFYISHGSAYYTYSFMPGWTWQDFIESEYNDGKISIVGDEVKFKGINTIFSEKPTSEIIDGATYLATINTYVYQPGYNGWKNIEEVYDKGTYTRFENDYAAIWNYYGTGIYPDNKDPALMLEADFTKYKKLIISVKSIPQSDENGDIRKYGLYVGYCTERPNLSSYISFDVKQFAAYDRLSYKNEFDTCTFDISSITGHKWITIICPEYFSGGAYIETIYFEE